MPQTTETKFDPFQTKEFGRGRAFGDDPRLLELYLNPKTRKKFLWAAAWAHACITPGEVSDQFGVNWTIERYLECNFVWGIILDVSRKLNPDLHTQLSEPILRKFTEPMGKHEKGRVPTTHKTFMSPLSTLYGYALPRVFLEIAGRGKKRTQERYLFAMEQLESAVKTSHSPSELLAKLTQKARCNELARTKTVTLLDHVLPVGVLTEENNMSQYRKVVEMLEKYAPSVFRTYTRLSFEKRTALGLADVEREQVRGYEINTRKHSAHHARHEDVSRVSRT